MTYERSASLFRFAPQPARRLLRGKDLVDSQDAKAAGD